MADACMFVMNLDQKTASDILFSYPAPCFANVGCGADISILELAEIVRDVVGFTGKLIFDTSKPDGTPKKLLDVTRLQSLGWQPKIHLLNGIQLTYQWFLESNGSFKF